MSIYGRGTDKLKHEAESDRREASGSARNYVAGQRVGAARAGRPRSVSFRLDVRRLYDCGENVVTSSTILAVVREPPPDAPIRVRAFLR